MYKRQGWVNNGGAQESNFSGNVGAGRGREDKVGRFSGDPKKLVKADGTQICLPFQRANCNRQPSGVGCTDGTTVRAHCCAVIKSVEPYQLCESIAHPGMRCSMKV